MLTTSRTPGILHAGSRTSRSTSGVLGFMLACAASILLLRLLLHFFQDENLPRVNQWNALGLALVGCVLFYIGTTLFISFVTGNERKLRISDEGIRYGWAWLPWTLVHKFEVLQLRGFYQIRVVLKRSWFRNRWLLTDEGMSREQSSELVEALRALVLPSHPDVVISDLPQLKGTSGQPEPLKLKVEQSPPPA
ncbi:MAG: hypothetical protein R3F13_11290 [Prosthecobacter sp.]